MRGEDRLQSDPNTPGQVGEYQLATLLGTGGMGRVYLAFDSRNTPVAVKVIRSELSEESRFRLRFAREVHAMRAVSGPCTADLLAADLDATPQWIAMEYVPGPTLQRALDSEGPLPADTVRLLAWALAEGLSDIHRAGVIHRDLKPGNIILGPDGPLLLDFGIARSVDAATVTELGERPGSLGWMAPEQLRDAEQGTFTDVHAWGAVVYAAATGESPFGAGPAEAVAWRIENVDPSPDHLRRAVPDIAEVVLQALKTEPSQRPTVAELIAATRTVADRDATTVKGSTDIRTALATYWVAPEVAEDNSPPLAPSTGEPPTPAAGRKRWRVVATLAAATVTLGVVGGLVVDRRNSVAEPPENPASLPSMSDDSSSESIESASDVDSTWPSDPSTGEILDCSSWVVTTQETGCPFARSVANIYTEKSNSQDYWRSTSGPSALEAVYNQSTDSHYDMACSRDAHFVTCWGGDGLLVEMDWPPPYEFFNPQSIPTAAPPDYGEIWHRLATPRSFTALP